MLLEQNENMYLYEINDTWEKIANNGDVITMQPQRGNGRILLQVVDNQPSADVNFGFILDKNEDYQFTPFECTHDVYVKYNSGSAILLVQKD